MAISSSTDRARVWRGLMRWWSQFRTPIAIISPDLLAAVEATDTWIDDNQSSYNSALPSAAQSGLTADQKTLLFCCVALARVNIGILRRVLGEVD